MRTHLKLVLVALVLNMILGLGPTVMAPPPLQAQGQCANSYIVQRGDWLAKIARQFNTTVQELVRLNLQLMWNPNLIYPGQVLCLPGKGPLGRTLAVEATFEYALAQEIPTIVGTRQVYSLTKTLVVTDSAKLDAALQGTPSAVIVKNSGAPTYSLYEVGASPLVAATQISPTEALNLESGCNAVSPVNDVIVSMKALTTTLELAVEREDGRRVPLQITYVGLLDDSGKVKVCGSNRIVAILFPEQGKSKTYWALVPGIELGGVGPSPWYIYYSWLWGSWSFY